MFFFSSLSCAGKKTGSAPPLPEDVLDPTEGKPSTAASAALKREPPDSQDLAVYTEELGEKLFRTHSTLLQAQLDLKQHSTTLQGLSSAIQAYKSASRVTPSMSAARKLTQLLQTKEASAPIVLKVSYTDILHSVKDTTKALIVVKQALEAILSDTTIKFSKKCILLNLADVLAYVQTLDLISEEDSQENIETIRGLLVLANRDLQFLQSIVEDIERNIERKVEIFFTKLRQKVEEDFQEAQRTFKLHEQEKEELKRQEEALQRLAEHNYIRTLKNIAELDKIRVEKLYLERDVHNHRNVTLRLQMGIQKIFEDLKKLDHHFETYRQVSAVSKAPAFFAMARNLLSGKKLISHPTNKDLSFIKVVENLQNIAEAMNSIKEDLHSVVLSPYYLAGFLHRLKLDKATFLSKFLTTLENIHRLEELESSTDRLVTIKTADSIFQDLQKDILFFQFITVHIRQEIEIAIQRITQDMMRMEETERKLTFELERLEKTKQKEPYEVRRKKEEREEIVKEKSLLLFQDTEKLLAGVT